MRITSGLTTLGNALILQLAFLLCALPLVTYAPSAIALQRQLGDAREGRATGFGSFAREFRRAWRQGWALGVTVLAVGAGFLVGIPFWFAVDAWFGLAAMAVLVALLGVASAFFLNVLHASERLRESNWRTWLAPAFGGLATAPLAGLWAMVQFLTWLVLMAFLPALAVVGAGLIPALIVRFTLGTGRGAARQAS
ncbi:DUF624 domain-containing protein [Streptomyces sp. SBT349]|uniref:DUF624 domain-containing protein n=1 Tax=Streptomyces sp. SBT349 TaxID=1580539 RepID=UPI00066E1858|nr:DUF624 domain-containing protein [Streptomyces sp. SBT349]